MSPRLDKLHQCTYADKNSTVLSNSLVCFRLSDVDRVRLRRRRVAGEPDSDELHPPALVRVVLLQPHHVLLHEPYVQAGLPRRLRLLLPAPPSCPLLVPTHRHVVYDVTADRCACAASFWERTVFDWLISTSNVLIANCPFY